MKKLFVMFVVMLPFTHLRSEPVWDSHLNWGTPVSLSAALADASDPQIVIDVNGNQTAVWVENGFIMANILPFGGSWGEAQAISLSGSSSPRLVVDGTGNVTAVWVQAGSIVTSSHPLGGSWSSLPTALSGLGTSKPCMAINSAGDIAVVWIRGGFIEATMKAAAGSFGLTPSVISAANSDNPHVSIGYNKHILAVWHSIVAGADLIYSSVATIGGGSWSAAKTITPNGLAALSHNYPKAVVDPDGNGYAIWYRYQIHGTDYLNIAVLSTTLTASTGNWAPIPTVLSQGGFFFDTSKLKSRIRIDSNGNVFAAWTMSIDASSFNIETAALPAGGNWLVTHELINGNLYAFDVDIAANSVAGLVTASMFFDGNTISIQVGESDFSGPFAGFLSSPITISDGTHNAFPKVATSFISSQNQINAGVVWLASESGTITAKAATGSKPGVIPPSNLSVVQTLGDFGVFQDYVNTVSWEGSTSPNLFGYIVYRNGILLAAVDETVFEIEEHNQVQNGRVTYSVIAMDSFGTQSPPVTVTIFP